MKVRTLVLWGLLWSLLPVHGWAAITEVGTQVTYAWTTPTSTPTLAAYTTTTGTQKVLAFGIAAYTENSAAVSACSAGGVACAVVSSTPVSAASGGGLITEWWIVKLGTHTGGSQTISLTFTANTESGFLTILELDGVDQTTPGVHGLGAFGAGGTQPTISVLTVAAGEYSVDVVSGFSGMGNGTPGGTATHTEVRDTLGGGGTATYVGKNTTATGTVVMSWANDTGAWTQSAMSLAVGSGGGPSGPPIGTLGLMGVGR